MDAKARPDQLREATNPLFNDRKLKLGTFCSNLSGGCAISSIDGMLEATGRSTLALARMGDEMEFEALVPVGRWKGFGGVTNFNGQGFESFTWAVGGRRLDQISRHLRHLACADDPSRDGGQAGRRPSTT